MSNRKKVTVALGILILVAIVGGSVQAAAREKEAKALTLAECLELAAKNNPQLKLAAVALDQAKLGLRETKSEVRKLEDLEQEAESGALSPPDQLPPGLAELWGLVMGMLAPPSDLETEFFKEHGVWAAQQQVALAQAGYDLADEGVRLAVLSAYYDLLQAEADLKTAIRAEKEATEARRVAAAQLEVGLIASAQDLAAQTGLAQARAGRLGAESVYEAKRLALLKEVGLDLDTEVALEPVTEPQVEFDLEQVVQAAIESSIDIKGAQFQHDLAQKKFELTAKRYPAITYKYRGAEYEYLQAQIKLLDTRVKVETKVRSSYNMYLAAKEQLMPAQRAVQQAEEDLRAIKAKLTLGAATGLDLLTAERAVAQAYSTLYAGQKNYVLAIASLEAAEKGLTGGQVGGGELTDARP